MLCRRHRQKNRAVTESIAGFCPQPTVNHKHFTASISVRPVKSQIRLQREDTVPYGRMKTSRLRMRFISLNLIYQKDRLPLILITPLSHGEIAYLPGMIYMTNYWTTLTVKWHPEARLRRMLSFR